MTPTSNQKSASTSDNDSLSSNAANAGAGVDTSTESAIDVLRGSVVGVLDSVVREYEPQIADFTANVAHQAVDKGVELAQTAVARVKAQSWMRIGLAAALGIGIIAVLGYEAEQSATSPRARKPLH